MSLDEEEFKFRRYDFSEPVIPFFPAKQRSTLRMLLSEIYVRVSNSFDGTG